VLDYGKRPLVRLSPLHWTMTACTDLVAAGAADAVDVDMAGRKAT
jgi:hypothetical protein